MNKKKILIIATIIVIAIGFKLHLYTNVADCKRVLFHETTNELFVCLFLPCHRASMAHEVNQRQLSISKIIIFFKKYLFS